MRIHKEGYGILLIVAIILVISGRIFQRILPNGKWTTYVLIFTSVLIFLFFLQFFRNPKRKVPNKKFKIISPADGKVVHVGNSFEKEVIQKESHKISIFMSPFNVHVNRYPADGEVIYVKHHPGKYLIAWHPKSSELNERCTTAIRTDSGDIIVVKQIAGILARRIINYARVGEKVKAGDELGFIKFGSRADIFWSFEIGEVKVKHGDRVKGGETILVS